MIVMFFSPERKTENDVGSICCLSPSIMLNITEWLIKDSQSDVPVVSMVMFFIVMLAICMVREDDD